jgi:Fe2+ or Zn2+ uptake regulation protein
MSQAQSVATSADFERMLRGVAQRVTRPRVAARSAVHDHPHADTDSIISVVREDLGQASHRAVRALTAAGLVRRTQPTGSVARYKVICWGRMSRVCCGQLCRIRQIIIDPRRSTSVKQPALDPEQPTSTATSHQKTSETEEGPTCLRVSAKARTQQSLPPPPSRPGPGRTGTGGRTS